MLRFYCFPSWTTCRKAKAWLSDNGFEFEYRDIIKNPLQADELKELAQLGGFTVKELLNPGSKGFRDLKLDMNNISDPDAVRLIGEKPKIMRRPLLSDGKKLVLGFKAGQYDEFLNGWITAGEFL